MLENYFGYIILSIIALVITTSFTVIGIFLGPKISNRIKKQPFESGLDYIPNAKTVKVKFFLVAMIFLIFDVEVALLYPYALVIHELSTPGFLGVMVFIFILSVGILYEYKRKILKW